MSSSFSGARITAALALAVASFFIGRFTAAESASESLTRSRSTLNTSDARPSSGHGEPRPATESASSLSSAARWQAQQKSIDAMTPSPARDEAMLSMLAAWAEVDPLAAHAYASKMLNRDTRAQAFTTVFTGWAKKDPAAAWEWVQKNEPDEHSHVRAVLVETARNNPGLAQRFAEGVVAQHPDAAAEIYLYALDGAMHDGNYEAARQIAANAKMPTEEQKNSLLNFLVGQWARYQPEGAAPWVLGLPAGSVREQALDSLGQAWSDIDPLRAADFAVKLPPGQARQTALRQAISKWTMDDPALASKWVLQFDAHQDFDQAVAAIATSNSLIKRDINLALSWAETIQEPALRRESTTVVVSNWYAQNPSAALNYIKTSPDLTVETRKDLMEKIVPLPLQVISRGL